MQEISYTEYKFDIPIVHLKSLYMNEVCEKLVQNKMMPKTRHNQSSNISEVLKASLRVK